MVVAVNVTSTFGCSQPPKVTAFWSSLHTLPTMLLVLCVKKQIVRSLTDKKINTWVTVFVLGQLRHECVLILLPSLLVIAIWRAPLLMYLGSAGSIKAPVVIEWKNKREIIHAVSVQFWFMLAGVGHRHLDLTYEWNPEGNIAWYGPIPWSQDIPAMWPCISHH